MDWNEIGRNSLSAARLANGSHARSSVSRAYYACHAVLTRALVQAGYTPSGSRQTPPHAAQANLIGVYFAGKGDRFVRELRAVIRRLYAVRLDADYNRLASFDKHVSLQAQRDAYRAFRLLEVAP